jgi:predicted negative regulator of RcsB-dependent stress response
MTRPNRTIVQVESVLSRSFTPTREDLLGELSLKEEERKEARRAREQAESELKRLTLEGGVPPASK